MPTFAFSGAITRSDGANIVPLDPFGVSIEVERDLTHFVGALPAAGSVVVPLGAIVHVQFVAIVATAAINVTLTKTGPIVMGPMKARALMIETTDLIGITVAHSVGSTADPIDVHIFMGGTKS